MIYKNILPATSQRVAAYTSPGVNETIRSSTIENLKCLENAEEGELSRRIQSLNAEWDIERFEEASAASCVIGLSLLGMSKRKFWSLLTLLAGTFLLQHALLGWCPTAPAMRKMGIRTAEEISQEKTVLKLRRGDFSQVKANDTEGLLKAAEK
jgi:hypothetical protein